MKITFDDKSYCEFRKSDTPDTIIVIVSARDQDNARKKTTNACEISMADFKKMVDEILK
jgi:hypothetical protein